MTDDQVNGLLITNAKVSYFPKKIEYIFTHLIVLGIENSGLKELSHEDLEPFSDIEYLYLSGNRLDTLEKGVFDNNKKLKGISMDNNKFDSIDGNVFGKILANLEFLMFNNCNCIDDETTTNFVALIGEIIENCD